MPAVEMQVTLVANTEISPGAVFNLTEGSDFDERLLLALGPDFPESADLLSEFAGRACYQSWDLPNPKTRENRDYLANIINQGHFSVMEHASMTLYVTGVSRSLLTELTRHRHLSFSVLSQRFVDSSEANYVIPPALAELSSEEVNGGLDAFALGAGRCYEHLVASLESEGLGRKQAREAARCVLPNMTETKFVVTGNHRAWREVIAKRISPHADAEIQAFAKRVLEIAKEIAPGLYQDMEVEGK